MASQVERRFSANGTTAFSRVAPWLPPITRMRIGPVRPEKRVAGGGTALMSARTGLPMTRAFTASPKLPGKASSTSRARCARQRLVKPAIAFCS